MSNELVEFELQQVVDFHDGDRSSSYPKRSEFVTSGVPFLNAESVSSGILREEGLNFITEEKFNSIKKGRISPFDTVLTMRGNGAGAAAIIPEKFSKGLINAQMLILRPKDTKTINPFFLYYYLSGPIGKQLLASRVSGSAQPQLTIRDLRTVKVLLPPIDKQYSIAIFLKSIDAKIELNRQINKNLDKIIRTIYKYLFLDFGPTNASARDKCPLNLSEEVLDLFTNKLVDSVVGAIPRGWNLNTIENICDTVTRGITPKYSEGTGKWIINQKVNRGSFLDFSELKELSNDLVVPTEKSTQPFDVLINCLGEGTLGRVAFYQGTEAYAVDQHMTICRCSNKSFAPFLYLYLSSPEGQARIESSKTGTTGMTMLNISKVRDFSIVVPPEPIQVAFAKIVTPLFDAIQKNSDQSRELMSMRNLAQPGLISGELKLGGV